MDYQKKFDEMFTALRSSPLVKIISADFYTKEEIIPSFYKKHGKLKKIEDEIKALNDNKILWSYIDSSGELIPMGESHLVSIEEVVSAKVRLWNDTHNEKERKILSELMPFDDHPESGDGMMGCLRIVNDNYEPWLYTENSEYYKMNLDISGYLDKLIQLKAIYGWQYLFVDLDLKEPQFNVVSKELKKRLQVLKACFPGASLNSYLKKL